MHINSKLFRSLASASVLWALSPLAMADSLNIFACEPEYASLAKELAPQASIYSATTALQDPHLVQAKPSLISKMRRADLVICAGAELEIGWLPMLQMKAANPQVRSTDLGLFFAADQVETLDKMAVVDRSMGDVHAAGNPHVHLAPERLLKIAKAFTEKLAQTQPEQAQAYQANYAQFAQRWQAQTQQWAQQALPLKGMKVIGYHSNFRYLFDWLGIEQIGDLEPKPGLPPSSAHLSTLLNRSQGAEAIVMATYQDPRGANWLASRLNKPVLNLPMTVGGNAQSQDLFRLYQDLIDQLLAVRSSVKE